MTTSQQTEDEWKPDPTDLLWNPPCSLPLKYWKRSEATQNAKDDHVDHLETLPYSREELILRTTLSDGREAAIEKNLFPYECPAPIEHWTLWSREEMSHRRICIFMEDWCAENKVDVVEWNYEENLHRSFDIPHVHVFIRFAETKSSNEVSTELSTPSSKRSFSSLDDAEGETTDEDGDSVPRKQAAKRVDSSPARYNVRLPSCFKTCSMSGSSRSKSSSIHNEVVSLDESFSDGEYSDDNWGPCQKKVRSSDDSSMAGFHTMGNSQIVCSDEITSR